MMLNSRQSELLKLIVEDYIKTVKPVSSSSLCKILKCSSATVRSEMSYLEEIKLLEKTHTSSGRIPSEKGYRYYVDNIMQPSELNGEEMLKLQTIFKNNSLILSDAILKSMEIISQLTNYTAVVLGTNSKDNKISKVEAVPLNDSQILAIIVTDKGHIEHKNITTSEKVSVEEIKKTVDLINKLIVGTPLDEVNMKLEFEVKPVIGKYITQHVALYNAFYSAFNDFANESNIKVNGTTNILMQPEFNNVDKIREIVSKFDNEEMVKSIKEEGNGVNIYIGSENEFDRDVAIIKTKYNINGEEGTIALIGPKRMEYQRATSLLNYILDNLK
ncbi:MAG: heat-inducible transcriptional repressor HrcA [Mycoplasmatota bacterium]